ncbi:MAG: hypothetical protein OQK82_08735, partial [Candidatus Pacearchaeota archaeon]|nr:hypothetical protein [Candidatus Pacearchaeota archaeon]
WRAIKEGYRKIIFADFDDEFEKNRVQVVSDLLDTSLVVVNDSDIVDLHGEVKIPRYFSQRYSEGDQISEHDLRYGNMMGLANTAARSRVFIDNQALVSGDAIAFDWYLWSSVLLNGNTATFTSKTATKYRVYNQNLAGLPQSLNLDYIKKGVEVKRQHYSLMSCLSNGYIEMAAEFQYVSEMLKNNEWGKGYLSALGANTIANHIWWENIQTPEEVGFK